MSERKPAEVVNTLSEQLIEALAADGVSEDARRTFCFALRGTSWDPDTAEEVQRQRADLNPAWIEAERKKASAVLLDCFENLTELLAKRPEVLTHNDRYKLACALREIVEVDANLTDAGDDTPVVADPPEAKRRRRASA